jgi:hypothetical protein
LRWDLKVKYGAVGRAEECSTQSEELAHSREAGMGKWVVARMSMKSPNLATRPVGHGADLTSHHHLDSVKAPSSQLQLDTTILDGLSPPPVSISHISHSPALT